MMCGFVSLTAQTDENLSPLHIIGYCSLSIACIICCSLSIRVKHYALSPLHAEGRRLTIFLVEVPKPVVVEPRDVILKVTGSTICGSDLHLLHGSVVEMEKGDILGHEFCGVVESMGSEVKNLEIGQRVVASFQIACGHVCILPPTFVNRF